MANTFENISTITVGSGGAATIDFTGIPATYTDLKLVYSLRNASNNTTLQVTFNNDGTRANYSYKQFYGNGTSVADDGQSDIFWGQINPSSYTADTFSNGELYVLGYLLANRKTVNVDAVLENNATAAAVSLLIGQWTGTAAINQITLSCYIGSFAQHSSASLYGIKSS
jgi:hypothetical protein